MRNISKRFGLVRALAGVDVDIYAAEIHALCGENGAGKSTLMKILSGLLTPDEGEIFLWGTPFHGLSARQAIAQGIGMVHQHFTLVPPLSVAENIVLGCEPTRFGFLSHAEAAAAVARLEAYFSLGVDPKRPVEELTVGEKQRVEIAKALYRGAKILVLDEPTAVLTPREVRQLFDLLRRLAEGGTGIVLITHKLDEVMEASTRITVLRQGRTVARFFTANVSAPEVARAMVGENMLPSLEAGSREGRGGEPVLEVVHLTVKGRGDRPAVRDVSFEVRAGEVVGIAGVEGNGQSELVQAIVGLRRPSRGEIRILGSSPGNVRSRLASGLAHIPEDRHTQGLILDMIVAENLVLGREWEVPFLGVGRRALSQRLAPVLDRHDIRPRRPDAAIRFLSGGNQQKVVVARELGRGARVIVAAHPTRGVDVGAVARIWQEIRTARSAGAGILLVSADLDEIFALTDRVLVMYGGTIVAALETARTSADEVGLSMTGATRGAPPTPPGDTLRPNGTRAHSDNEATP